MTDLVVRGGTVVTPTGTFPADVAIAGERIEAVGADLAADGVAALDARGLLVLPGVVDVHTHTRLPSDAEPDRFFRDSVAAALGGTTTFLCFDNPGTGISDDGARDPLAGVREFRARTEGESAVDFGLSAVLTGQQDDPAGAVPGLIDVGVPTFKAFMVYDFRLDETGLAQVLAATAARPAMLQLHCEAPGIIDALVAEALAAGRTAPRDHAACRPTSAEAQATARAIELAGAADAPLYVVHLSCAAALAHVARAKAGGRPVFAETCPHYLTLGDDRYELTAEEAIKSVISPPLRSPADRDALWSGLARGDLDLVATDHVPDRVAVEKRLPAPPFPEISNGGPGIETLLSVVYGEGVARARITAERLVEVLAATPARLFGLERKGAVEPGRDADLLLLDPRASRTIRQADLHHTSDYTPYEGLTVSGAVRHVLLRGRQIVEEGRYVGRRGDGRFQERRLAWRR